MSAWIAAEHYAVFLPMPVPELVAHVVQCTQMDVVVTTGSVASTHKLCVMAALAIDSKLRMKN